jgi:pantoate--beta-alanine ligase
MTRAQPRIIETVSDLRAQVTGWKASGDRVGLVPTMGALHDGHMALHSFARAHLDRTIVSIFVNPTQFAPTEDFSRYPRTFDDDVAKLAAAGCDAVWAPDASTMYPEGFATEIHMRGPADGLETVSRPHFFRGVALVCCKLFTQTGADFAMFGEKDYQQLAVVRRMAADLDLPIEIVAHPTVREPDGLAMSSRNAYLTSEQRLIAPRLAEIMTEAIQALSAGTPVATCESNAITALSKAGFEPVDYVAIRDAETLAEVAAADIVAGRPLRILGAAWLGQTRLIDNLDATIR